MPSYERWITVEHCGIPISLHDGLSLTFGRAPTNDSGPTLVLDESDLSLHRLCGRLWNDRGSWWVSNLGRRLEIEVVQLGTGSLQRLPPGRRCAVASTPTTVRVEAQRTVYAFSVSGDADEVTATRRPGTGVETVSVVHPRLTSLQRTYLVALCEPRLEISPVAPLPTNRQIARRLGITRERTVEQALDRLCEKFAACGIRGLKGEVGVPAAERKERLVRHVISARLIGPDDVALLD